MKNEGSGGGHNATTGGVDGSRGKDGRIFGKGHKGFWDRPTRANTLGFFLSPFFSILFLATFAFIHNHSWKILQITHCYYLLPVRLMTSALAIVSITPLATLFSWPLSVFFVVARIGMTSGVENNRDKARWIDHAQEITRGHGREETRTCHACSHLGWIPGCGAGWEGMRSFGTITAEKTMLATGETTTETRCFISSLEKDALTQLHIIRNHWKIENNLHWQLDVSFNEDDTRMKKNQLLSMAIFRKMAMPVLKAFTYKKGASLKKKMLAAALKPIVRRQILQQAIELYQKS